jgi:ATP adenylyltransferase
VEILWSPWRMAYISPDSAGGGEAPTPAPEPAPGALNDAASDASGCVFCDLPAQGPARDHANLLLLRGETMFVMLNRYPYNSGHLMIIPHRHLRDVGRLTPQECAEMMALLQRMVAALTAEYRPQGFNVGMNLGEVAGAGIAEHLHMHLVPRWGGDTNFMPVVGATKVLPEALGQTWTRLRGALARLG